MEEQEESGLTFGEICRLIGRRIWWVLGASVLAAVLAALVLALAVNPSLTYYSMQFSLVYPSDESGQYPDGSRFSYRTIISQERLEDAKASDDRFAGVDTAKMLKEDNISISLNTSDDTSAQRTYTISVGGSYFANADAAETFIIALVGATENNIIERASQLEYSISEEAFRASSFDARLELLANEYDAMLDAYDGWIETYSAGYRVIYDGVGRSLSDYRADLYSLFSSGLRESLKAQCENGGFGLLYGDGETLEQAVEDRREQLLDEKERNELIIADLQAALAPAAALRTSSEKETAVSGDVSLSSLLASYIERNAIIETQIGADGTGGSLTYEEAVKFADRLDDCFHSLNAAGKTLTSVTAAIYAQNTFSDFVSRSADVTGGISPAIGGVAAFIVVFLVGAIGVCVSRSRRSKQQA